MYNDDISIVSHQQPESMCINRIIVGGTSGYHNFYQRPYEMTLDNRRIDVVGDILDRNKNTINDYTFRDVVGDILAPQATINEKLPCPIANGWGERRLRFIIEVEFRYRHSNPTIGYYQGYTTFDGWSNSCKDFDRDMDFVINSYITVVRRTRVLPNGERTYMDVISSSGQLESDSSVGTIFNPTRTYIIRPQDLFRKISENELHMLYSQSDDRSNFHFQNLNSSAHALNNSPKANDRRNNIPVTYMTRMLQGFYKAASGDKMYSNNSDLMNNAVGEVSERDPTNDPFIMALNGIKNRLSGHRFDWGTIMTYDPTVYDRLDIIESGDRYSREIIGTDGEYWTGSDLTTQIANIVSQSVPGLMMKHNLTKVSYYCTNMTMDGRIDSRILFAKSVSTADMSFFYQKFEDEFPELIAYTFSSGFSREFSININSDIFGDTDLTISINGEPETKFVLPTFCDSIIPPIITSDTDRYDTLVESTNMLVNGALEHTEFNTSDSIDGIIVSNGGNSHYDDGPRSIFKTYDL